MPFIYRTIIMYPVFVLFLGLISCSPEQPEKDSLRIQEPEILTEKRNPIKISSLEPNFTRNLQDRIRFQEIGLRLSIKSTCLSAQTQETYESQQVRPIPRELLIAEILPPTLLTRKNPKESQQFHCSFTLAAINNKGSEHRFKIPPRLLEERFNESFQTSLQVNGAPTEATTFGSPDLEKVWVLSPRANSFHLSCIDLQIKMKSSTDLVSLNELLKSSDAEKIQISIQRAPTQSCRILTYQNGLLNGWSSIFTIDWPSSKLDIQATSTINPEYWPQTVFGTLFKPYEVTIKNPYPFPIYFSIPNQQEIIVLAMQTEEFGYKLTQPFSIQFDKSTKGLILNEKKPSRIGLNVGAQVTFRLIAKFTNFCNHRTIAFVYPFHSLSVLQIKRHLNMTDDMEVGAQDFVPRKAVASKNGHVSGFTPRVPGGLNPPGC